MKTKNLHLIPIVPITANFANGYSMNGLGDVTMDLMAITNSTINQ